MCRKVTPKEHVSPVLKYVYTSFAGCIMAYTLYYYKSNYPSLLAPSFYDAHYPDEDNLSTGFYMAACACVLLFISAITNCMNVAVYFKYRKSVVTPNKETDIVAVETGK